MLLIKCLASISLAAITLPTLHSEPHCPGNAASIRFRLVQSSRIIVPVTINHTGPYEFLVDTGTESTIVDPSLATELHLKTRGSAEVVGVGFSTQASFAYLDLLEAGSHSVADHLVVVLDLQPFQAADLHFRGIISGDFLAHFDVLMDYAHRMLCLDDTKVMQPEMKGKHVALVTPPHPDDEVLSTEPLIISVQLSGIAATPLLQLLDSGISVPLLYDSGKEIAAGFSVNAPIRDQGPDGVERVFDVLPPQEIKIGTLALHQISFVTLKGAGKDVPKVGVDGLLPTSLFRRVYISYADRFVVLEP